MEKEIVPVDVCILTMPERKEVFERHLAEINNQDQYKVANIFVICEDPVWQEGYDSTIKNLTQLRNRVISLATSEWILTTDDDDYWHHDHLKTVWETHLANPNAEYINPLSPRHIKHVEDFDFSSTDLTGCGAMTTEALLHRETFLRWGGFIYVKGLNEDVATDIHLVRNCGIERVYTDHYTYAWLEGDHDHMTDKWEDGAYAGEKVETPQTKAALLSIKDGLANHRADIEHTGYGFGEKPKDPRYDLDWAMIGVLNPRLPKD